MKTSKLIKPTSVEAKGAFSALGYFAYKTRSSFNTNALDTSLLMHYLYEIL